MNQPRVDVVEDDEATCRVFQRVAERAGALVRTYAAAEDALAAMLRDPPAVAIIDVNLAGDMNGLELTEMLKQCRRTTHVLSIVVSASVTEADQRRAMRAGADAWMSKPICTHRLAEQLHGLMRDRSAPQVLHDA